MVYLYEQAIKFVFDDPIAFADGFFQLKAVQDFDMTGGSQKSKVAVGEPVGDK